MSHLEGWSDVRVSYIGGLSVQLDFTSGKAAADFLSSASAVWKDWFSSLMRWSVDCHPNKRLALLDIHGIPLHAWNEESLHKIGKLWGEVVSSDLEGARGINKSVAQVYVLTERIDWIIDSAAVLIGETKFGIRVVERPWDGWEVGEIMSSEGNSIKNNLSDDASSWAGSTGDENEINLSPEDENKINVSPENIEVSQGSEPGKLSPATKGKEDGGSSDRMEECEKLMQSCSSRKEKGYENCRLEKVHGDLEKSTGVEDLHNERGTHSPILGLKESASLVSVGPGPRSDGPKNDFLEWAARSGTKVDSGTIYPDYNYLNESPTSGKESNEKMNVQKDLIDDQDMTLAQEESFYSEESECWLPQAKICNCARRRRSRACKHSFLEGSTVGEPFVMDIDNQISSDSENLIRRSTKRVLVSSLNTNQRYCSMLNFLSWNINGMGKESKRKWVKDVVRTHNINFLYLQETKSVITSEWQVMSVWGKSNMEFAALDSIGNSSGILTIWDELQAESDAAWVICGYFNEVRCAEERKGSALDRRGTKLFNDFIATTGLQDLRLGGRKFTWMNADCSKLSKLDRHLLGNPEFENLVKEKWNDNLSVNENSSKIDLLSLKLRHLKSHIKKWSVETRKKEEAKISSLKNQICTIDLLAEVNPIDESLVKERVELTAKVNELMSRKIRDIKQKAKNKWLIDGDENTQFFHGYLNNKLKKLRIHGVNINGGWVTNPELIKSEVWDFFDKKFAEHHPIRPIISSNHFKKISASQKEWLESPFSAQEVKNAVRNCGYNKAPGPDGFTLDFVWRFWDIVFVGADFVEAQTAYIKGRSILDGPLMVNELISWAKKAKKKLLILKVDFAKAFDSLNWNFLDSVLMKMGFGETWRAWMKGCICTAKVSVLINGSPTKEFLMGKGVRQGGPLAPFLFILAAEGLMAAMKEAQQANIFQGVRVNNVAEDVSLFQFADDAIFVGEWSLKNAKNLLRILKCFEVCSGLKINLSKSRLSGVSVSKEEVAYLARRLNCKEETIPFHYLGLMVGGNMNLAKNWQPLIDKFRTKLSDWKAKTLSIGGGVPYGNRGTWNSIVGVEKELREMGINVNSFLKPKEDGSGWVWELDSSNVYTVKSLRRLIDGVTLPLADTETEWIRWIPNKLNIHLWRVLSNRLPTRDNLLMRGVTLTSTDCPLCHAAPECLDHVMTSCSTAKVINAHMSKTGVKGTSAEVCKAIGAAFLSEMWKTRNNVVFKREVRRDMEIAREIQTVAYNWVRCRSKGGISWESWLCNPTNVVAHCNALASR
ncbi:hypothetical protein OSB04_012446 [Centaurea solstitialis]|uniref:Reverse transcriptase domain-containing protein n=1 Tax=Centaurea solstitialis TaxID=347529 RepID=A0AA38TUF9_9ASTR|nr:hypothetical protein OSB04_012446 [Centaurea solstitialis]